MTDTVREDELHAYVDGALPEARRLEVEAWLAAHPADAARVDAWAQQNRSLHAAFDAVLNEPLPIELVRAAGRTRAHAPLKAAAAVLALAVSGLVGYGIGLQREPIAMAETAPLVRDAAIAHVVFTPEARHPVEVPAADAEHLVAWLSKRLGTELRAPDFSAAGFDLLGGRLLAGASGPVAQFMYEDAARRRVTLYVRRDASGNGETAFRHATDDGVDVFYWIDRDFGYALSGQIAASDLRKLAGLAYGQMAGGAQH